MLDDEFDETVNMDVERGIAIDMCSTFQYFEHARFQLLNRMYSSSIYVELLSGKQIPDTGAGGSARSRPLYHLPFHPIVHSGE